MLPTAQGPQAGVREPRGHRRNLHNGCKLCKLNHKGCRWVCRLLARVGLPREQLFLPHSIGAQGQCGGCSPSGRSASLTINFLLLFQKMGLGRSWEVALQEGARCPVLSLPFIVQGCHLGACTSVCILMPRVPREPGRGGGVSPLQGHFQRGLARPGHPLRGACG